MRPMNDGLRFLLELCALASVAYWGWSEHGGVWRWVLVVAAPFVVVLVWGRFMAPKSPRRVTDPWRLLLEVVIFGGAAAALADADQTVLAIAFAATAAIHLLSTFVLGQR
jgi:hypothetical protein